MAMAGTMWPWPCLHRVMGDWGHMSPWGPQGLLCPQLMLSRWTSQQHRCFPLLWTLAPSFPDYTGPLMVTQVFSHQLNPNDSQMSILAMDLATEPHACVTPASLGSHSV